MTAAARRSTRPQPLDPFRAIYLDFEGFSGRSPSLMGILEDGVFAQVVLDRDLAEAGRARGLRCSSLLEEAARLLRRCETEGCLLVAYSQYELRVLREHAGLDFGPHYLDARRLAKRWWNRDHPDATLQARDLKSLLALVGFERASFLGERKSTHRLRGVLEGLARGGSYQALTPTQKGKWWRLLEHNRIDCFGMRALVEAATP